MVILRQIPKEKEFREKPPKQVRTKIQAPVYWLRSHKSTQKGKGGGAEISPINNIEKKNFFNPFNFKARLAIHDKYKFVPPLEAI